MNFVAFFRKILALVLLFALSIPSVLAEEVLEMIPIKTPPEEAPAGTNPEPETPSADLSEPVEVPQAPEALSEKALSALPPQLRINEVDLEAEFIELHNFGTETIDAATFEFSELVSGKEVHHKFSEFSSALILEPNTFFVLSMSRKLNNTGETIKLYANAEMTESFATLEVPALQAGKSYAREATGNYSWTVPTPGGENFPEEPSEPEPESPPDPEPIPETPPQNFEQLHVNEVSLEVEFIELFNGGEIELDLEGFEFSELSGTNQVRRKFSAFQSNLILPAGGYLLLNMDRILNNAGETIKIFPSSESSEAIRELTIPANVTVKSFARQSDGSFAWVTPTPGLVNSSPDSPSELPPQDPSTPIPENSAFSNLILNEVDLEAEFIELKNIGEVPLDLQTFQFSELSGANEARHNLKDFAPETMIAPNSFLMITLASKLNNSGDTIRLYVHSAATLPLQTLEVPAGKSGQSFARTPEGSFSWTTSITPAVENIIVLPPSSVGSMTTKTAAEPKAFFEPPAQVESVPATEVEILISEVAFKDSEHDRIELFCQKCGTLETPIDLGGYRFFDDHVFFELPAETFLNTGQYLVLKFKGEPEEKVKTEYGWDFTISHKGLTGTDETVMLVDSEGEIEDAVCWSDQNGDFSSGEKDDVEYMIGRGHWNSDRNGDFQCFSSLSITGKMSLARKNGIDTHTAADFFPTVENTFGSLNPERIPTRGDMVNLRIESLLVLPKGSVLLGIRNEGEETIELKDFQIKNIRKTLFTVPDISLPAKSGKNFLLKKFPLENNFLLLADAWGAPEDFWCLNPPEAEFLNEAGSSLLFDLQRKGFWPDREFDSCLFIELLPGALLRNTHPEQSAASFEETSSVARPMTEATELIVSKVVPNPKGKDEGQEWLKIQALQDLPDISSWMLQLGANLLPLPAAELFAGEGMKLTAENFHLPTLKNTDGGIALISPEGKIFEMTWDKAKDDAVLEIIDGVLAWDLPVVSAKSKTTKEKNKKEPEELVFSGDEIQVEIVSVLPNPEGKDSGAETVVLRNVSEKEGYLRYFQFSNGKTKKKIPETFFALGEEKIFLGKDIVPNLKNTDGTLEVLDPFGQAADRINWGKARDGEPFGRNIVWTKPTKKKAAKKKSTAAKKVKIPKEFSVSGILESFTEQELVIRLEDGSVRTYRFSEKSPQKLFFLQKILVPGRQIELTLLSADQTISAFRTELQSGQNWYGNLSIQQIRSSFLLSLFFGMAIFSFFLLRKIKYLGGLFGIVRD